MAWLSALRTCFHQSYALHGISAMQDCVESSQDDGESEGGVMKTCARCPADISMRNSNALYCYECSLNRSDEAQRASYRKRYSKEHWKQYR